MGEHPCAHLRPDGLCEAERYNWSGNRSAITGDTDGDGTADFALWLTGQVVLTAGDFVL